MPASPFEIMIGPIQVYSAPSGTDMPDVNGAVPSLWVPIPDRTYDGSDAPAIGLLMSMVDIADSAITLTASTEDSLRIKVGDQLQLEAEVVTVMAVTTPGTVFVVSAFTASHAALTEIFKLGLQGRSLSGRKSTERHTSEGVTVGFPQSVEGVRANGTTLPVKAFRPEEDIMVEFTVMDVTVEGIVLALRNVRFDELTTKVGADAAARSSLAENERLLVAGSAAAPGYKGFRLERGPDVDHRAYLCRGFSPYLDNVSPAGVALEHSAQYYLPAAYNSGSPSLVYSKNGATGVQFSLMALAHDVNDAIYVAVDDED